jgi:hypothetical protein
MADIPPPAIIEWADFVPLAAVPAQAKVASVGVAPGGRTLSIILENFEARCDGRGQKTATAYLVGSIEAKIPDEVVWTASKADFSGTMTVTRGARLTVQFGLAQAFAGQTVAAPLEDVFIDGVLQPSDINGNLLQTLYSPTETATRPTNGEPPSYAPLTISVQLTVACAGDASSAQAIVDAVDVNLWVN